MVHGNKLMGECLAINMIKEANLLHIFSDSVLKLGGNIGWVEILHVKFLKKLIASSLIRKYDVIIVIFMWQQLTQCEVFIASLFFNGLS